MGHWALGCFPKLIEPSTVDGRKTSRVISIHTNIPPFSMDRGLVAVCTNLLGSTFHLKVNKTFLTQKKASSLPIK